MIIIVVATFVKTLVVATIIFNIFAFSVINARVHGVQVHIMIIVITSTV